MATSKQKVAKFRWDSRKSKAAQMLADGKTEEQICAEIDVARKTLWDWKGVEEFDKKIRQIIERTQQALLGQGIRIKENRVGNLQARVDKMLALIEARGREMGGEVEGGELGLYARDLKGKDADRPVYKFDAALLKELREHEKQAAIELGQWSEKHELTGKDGAPLTPISVVEVVKPDGV